MTTTNSIVGFQRPLNLFVKRECVSEFYTLSEKCGKKFKKIVKALKKNKDVDNPYALAKYIVNNDVNVSEDDGKSKLLMEYCFCGVYHDYLSNIYYDGNSGAVWGRSVTEAESKYDVDNSDYIDEYNLYYFIIKIIVDKLNIKKDILNTLTDKAGDNINCGLLLLLGWSPETVKMIVNMYNKYNETLIKFVKDNINCGDYLLFANIDLFKEKFTEFITNVVNASKANMASNVLYTEEDKKITRKLNNEEEKKDETIATTSKLSNYMQVTSDFKFDIGKLYVLTDGNNDIKLITDNIRLVTLLKHFSDNVNMVKLFIKSVDFLHNFRPVDKDEEK